MTVSKCPACGSASSETTGPEAAGFSAVVNGETFQEPDYFVLECVQCGLLYRSDAVTGRLRPLLRPGRFQGMGKSLKEFQNFSFFASNF